MMVDVCTDGVVMMVMAKDDYDKACWQQLFGKKPFAGPFGKWWFREMVVSVLMLLVSWWSFNCVSVVVGVLVALWAVCP